MAKNFTSMGKQVLDPNGDHFADAVDVGVAQEIAAAMMQRQRIVAHLEAEAARRPRARAFTRGIRFAAEEVRNGFFEEDGQ